MRSLTTHLTAILTISALALSAGSATAGGFKWSGKGVTVKVGSNHNKHYNYKYHKHYNKAYVKKVYVKPIYDHCYYPPTSYCFVLPGECWYTLSHRIYGDRNLARHIAGFNGLSLGASLIPGQQLQLPVINQDGTLAASTAPAPAPIAPQGQPFGAQGQAFGPQGAAFGPQGPMTGSPLPTSAATMTPGMESAAPPAPAAPAAPAANIRVESAEASLPSVAIGSVLVLDSASLGSEPGSVRLRISGVSLPVEVLEWTGGSAKIRLPEMELSESLRAEIEVLRADGSLASRSAIRLTPAATRLALTN